MLLIYTSVVWWYLSRSVKHHEDRATVCGVLDIEWKIEFWSQASGIICQCLNAKEQSLAKTDR
jgi:hypothetical protein